MTVRSFLVCLLAAAGGFRLELNLRARGDSRPYLYQAEVTRAEADGFGLGGNALQKYQREAQKGYAEKKAYREAIYGAEFWKNPAKQVALSERGPRCRPVRVSPAAPGDRQSPFHRFSVVMKEYR